MENINDAARIMEERLKNIEKAGSLTTAHQYYIKELFYAQREIAGCEKSQEIGYSFICPSRIYPENDLSLYDAPEMFNEVNHSEDNLLRWEADHINNMIDGNLYIYLGGEYGFQKTITLVSASTERYLIWYLISIPISIIDQIPTKKP